MGGTLAAMCANCVGDDIVDDLNVAGQTPLPDGSDLHLRVTRRKFYWRRIHWKGELFMNCKPAIRILFGSIQSLLDSR